MSGSNGSRTSPFVNPNPHGGQKRAAGYVYVPRIYGFKVSERAKSGPRMQWLRLRPESPEELDMVDWRGRWINEDDEYDEDEDPDDEDRQMEDFDPVSRISGQSLLMGHLNCILVVQDAADDDDEDEEEEEEEEAGAAAPMSGTKAGKQVANVVASGPPSSSPVNSARTSPTSSGAPRTQVDHSVIALPTSAFPSIGSTVDSGRVKMVRQWAARNDWPAVARTAQV